MRWCEENGVDYVFGLAKNARLLRILGAELHEAKLQFEPTGQASRVFKDFTVSDAEELEPRASRGGQGRAFGQGKQSAVRRDLALGRAMRRPHVVRRRVLRPRRHGESDQGAAAVPVRRPHELSHDASQSIAVVVVERGLRAACSVTRARAARHADGSGAVRHDSVEVVEDRGVSAGDGSAGLDLDVGELSLSGVVCSGD